MAEFWIRQHTSGQVRGPVTSAQLKVLAKQGRLQPSDEIGRSREGPWQPADRLQGLQFATESQPHFQASASNENPSREDGDAIPDFATMVQEPSSSPAPAPAEDSVPHDDVVHIDAGLSKDDAADRETPTPAKSSSLNAGNADNKFRLLRLIAKAHQRMGVVCLILAAISLVAFFYFLISYAMTDRTATAGPAPAQEAADLDDLADQLQQQLLRASSEIENVARRAKVVSRIWGSLILTFSMGWGAILCFAFSQLILLVLDIERNTRRERDDAEAPQQELGSK